MDSILGLDFSQDMQKYLKNKQILLIFDNFDYLLQNQYEYNQKVDNFEFIFFYF